MEKGFNSDLKVSGQNFHVQTEDWGRENPFLVSRVFCSGAVIKSFKVSYQEVLPRGVQSEARSIVLAMRVQHDQILDLVRSGHLRGHSIK